MDRRYRRINRLSAALFLGFDLDSPLQVHHTCDRPPCWNPDHLWIGTQLENIADRHAKGRTSRASRNRGSSHGIAVVDETTVREIKELLRDGVRQAEICRRFALQRQTVWEIAHGRNWKHVAV